MSEKAFVMIKPDHADKAEAIFRELDHYGRRVQTVFVTAVPETVIQDHYSPHREKPFYGYMVASFVDQAVLVAVYEGEGVIQRLRDVIGPTDPQRAPSHTIRGRFSRDSLDQAIREQRPVRNVVHCSESPAEAERELAVWQTYLKSSF